MLGTDGRTNRPRLTTWCEDVRRIGPRGQRSESGQLLLRRGAGLGRGEPGAVHPAQLLRHRAVERLSKNSHLPWLMGREGMDWPRPLGTAAGFGGWRWSEAGRRRLLDHFFTSMVACSEGGGTCIDGSPKKQKTLYSTFSTRLAVPSWCKSCIESARRCTYAPT